MNNLDTIQAENSNPMEGFIDKKEVANRLKTTPRTIEVWAQKGVIPCIKIGRSVLYNWTDIVSHLNERYRVTAKR